MVTSTIILDWINWLPILTDMQPLAVNHFRNLFSSHSSVDFVFLLLSRQNTSKLDSALAHLSVLACEAVKYGFFDFHKLMVVLSYRARFLLFFLIEFTKS